MRPFDKHNSGLFNGTDPSSAALDGANSGFAPDFGGIPDPIAADPGLLATSVPVGIFESHDHPSNNGPPVVTPPINLPIVPASPTAFTIKVIWDQSVEYAPGGFTSDILAAVNFLETRFTDPVTVTIDVGYGEAGGYALQDGALGESISNLAQVSYGNLVSAVAANATTPTDASVVASLPATSPINGATYYVTTAQAKALGLASNSGLVDGSVGFAGSLEFTYGDTNTSGTVAARTYDFFTTALHEITEVMGRQMETGAARYGTPNSYSLLDLLHYSAAGTPDFSSRVPGYFSVDGGVTNLGEFNTNPGGDSGDWATSVTDDSFDAYSTTGALETVTPNDLTEMDAIGWQPAGSGGNVPVVVPITPPSTPTGPVSDPTGVSFAPEPRYLTIAQGWSGLSPGSPLVVMDEVGGTASDKFSYTLSGTSAADFNVIPAGGGQAGDGQAGDGAVLTVGARAVGAAVGGSLYALTVTATDETATAETGTGHPHASDPVNIVFGDGGDDTINLASLPGIATATPTFINGFSGDETISGAGMTGALYFNSGTGADTMTGGSGTNVYEFGAGAAGSAMDIITNFNAAADQIDLTWIGSRFSGVAALGPAANSIAANSVGWQTSGGNTFVYANTTARSEALSSANLKVELLGNVPLTGANFGHT